MNEEKRRKLEEMKARLKDLKSRDPSHCAGTHTFVPHVMPPSLWEEIEELEAEIRALETERADANGRREG